MKIPLNVVGDSNDENNFLHKFLVTNTQVSKIGKTFASGSSTNIKLMITGITGNPLMLPANGYFSLMDSIEKESKNMGVKNKKL